MSEPNGGRLLAIAALVRMHGPEKAAELVKAADEAHAKQKPLDVEEVFNRVLGRPK